MDRRRFLLAAAAAPFALDATLAAAATGPLVLVTEDDDARVAVVELATGRIRSRIPTSPSPFSIELVGSHAVVAHTVLGKVSIIGGSPLEVRHELPVAESRYTASAGDGRHAFVTDSGGIAVHTVDVVAGRIVASLRLKEWPRHLSLSPDRRTLWVGLGTASQQIAVVDVADPRRPRLERYLSPGFLMHDVGFAPSGGRIWVTGGAANTIAVREQGVFRVLPADRPPQHVTFLGDRVFVSSGASGTLRVYTHEGKLLRMTRIPIGSFNVQYAAGKVLTPSLGSGTLTVLSAAGHLLESVRVSASCHDACLAPAA